MYETDEGTDHGTRTHPHSPQGNEARTHHAHAHARTKRALRVRCRARSKVRTARARDSGGAWCAVVKLFDVSAGATRAEAEAHGVRCKVRVAVLSRPARHHTPPISALRAFARRLPPTPPPLPAPAAPCLPLRLHQARSGSRHCAAAGEPGEPAEPRHAGRAAAVAHRHRARAPLRQVHDCAGARCGGDRGRRAADGHADVFVLLYAIACAPPPTLRGG